MDSATGDFGVFVEKFQAQNEQNLGWMKVRAHHPATLRLSADSPTHCLQTFCDQVTHLTKLYRDACRDLERERIAGRHAQENVEKMDQKFRALEESAVRSAFVLVLIDADADAYLVRQSLCSLRRLELTMCGCCLAV